jgi:hypothetical protein
MKRIKKTQNRKKKALHSIQGYFLDLPCPRSENISKKIE